MLQREAQLAGVDVEVINISGGEESIEATPGAFLNFQQTNIYKNTQMNDIAKRFSGEIQPGDKFLFTDAWHPGIIQLKYMSELLQIPVEIHSMWHAGSYDPQDFLGRLIKDKRWTYNAERSFFHASDYNWFATNFHMGLFDSVVFGGDWGLPDSDKQQKILRTGWPMDYMPATLRQYYGTEKENIIIFPHRIAPEKQPEIFYDLRDSLPEYEFVVCQEQQLSKSEYHQLLAKSKLMFSANLQETLGISPYEGAILDVFPLVPDRLSYTEMYPEQYKYPGVWTANWNNYVKHKDKLIDRIRLIMEAEMSTQADLEKRLLEKYFTATKMVAKLLEFPDDK
jgi:hypothetical protein